MVSMTAPSLGGRTAFTERSSSLQSPEPKVTADLPILDCDDTCPFCWGPETD